MPRQASDLAKTLDRGLQVLDLLADHPEGLTLTEITTHLGTDRTVIHRLIRTLAAHHLVKSDEHKRYQIHFGVIRLAESIRHDLHTVALPVLDELANTVKATANIAVPDGHDVIVLTTVEPRCAPVHVAYRAGQRHPLNTGSAGLAILAARVPQAGERPEIAQARAGGYAVTHEEVIPSTWGVSEPVCIPHRRIEASTGVTLFAEEPIEWASEQVRLAAQTIASELN